MNLYDQLTTLVNDCDTEERELIEQMIRCAANYVQAVTEERLARMNLTGLEDSAERENITVKDATRSRCHNAFIDAVNIVNRLCEAHGLSLIYTGEKHRYHYGTFAGQLVSAVFENR